MVSFADININKQLLLCWKNSYDYNGGITGASLVFCLSIRSCMAKQWAKYSSFMRANTKRGISVLGYWCLSCIGAYPIN